MATVITPTSEENSLVTGDNTSQSALELLKPDPEPVENSENKAEEEDELEALRQAALMSIRPKKSAFKVQAHPVRQNLLSIVPVEDEPVAKKPVSKPFGPKSGSQARDSPSKSNKFARYDSDKSTDLSSSEEEIEVEEEVTATESETEPEPSKDVKKEPVKKQISEADDVLNVDCTEEVDEFTNFLNEFEDELKPKAAAPKPKKTKIIKVKKKVKKQRPQANNKKVRSRSRSPYMNSRPRRSPPMRRYTPPRSRYSPPHYRRRSSRSPSPYYRRPRRYSRSPSPRRGSPGRRYRSRSPRPFRSPRRGSPGRFSRRTPSLSPEPTRAGSAPKQVRDRPRSPKKTSPEVTNNKSKSLPPSKAPETKNKKVLTNEEKAEKLAAEKIKQLPSPERERLLQRRKKFESNAPVKPVANKKISLKKTQDESLPPITLEKAKKRPLEDNNENEDISLDVDDTLDMFEEESHGKNRKQIKGAEKGKANVTDLRVKLYKKNQKLQTPPPKQTKIEIEEELDDYEDFDDDDRDSLEKAHLSSDDEQYSPKNIQITSNRIVKKPASLSRVVQEQTLKIKTTLRPNLMKRLGAKVSDQSDDDDQPSPKKYKSSDENETISKKEKKKKEKKEKKKKKDKKKEKKKSKKHQNSDSDDKNSEEDLFKYFENLDDDQGSNDDNKKFHEKEDILMDKMKKKNEKTLKRHEEIEQDRKLHA